MSSVKGRWWTAYADQPGDSSISPVVMRATGDEISWETYLRLVAEAREVLGITDVTEPDHLDEMESYILMSIPPTDPFVDFFVEAL